MANEKMVAKSDKIESAKAAKNHGTVIDGKDLILGRLGSVICKRLLMGETISIVNCKDIIILGKKKYLVDRFKHKQTYKVILHGPFIARSPSDMVRRTFRGMVPYHLKRGSEALKRLKLYNSVPSTLLSAKKETVEGTKVDEGSVFYYTRMEDLCNILGYTKRK